MGVINKNMLLSSVLWLKVLEQIFKWFLIFSCNIVSFVLQKVKKDLTRTVGIVRQVSLKLNLGV